MPVNNVAYFCGAMRADDPITTDIPREITRKLLETDMHRPWVYAAKPGSFRYRPRPAKSVTARSTSA